MQEDEVQVIEGNCIFVKENVQQESIFPRCGSDREHTLRYEPYFIPTPHFPLSRQEDRLIFEFVQEVSLKAEVRGIKSSSTQHSNLVTHSPRSSNNTLDSNTRIHARTPISMAMTLYSTVRLPSFHGIGKDDVEQHWLTNEVLT